MDKFVGSTSPTWSEEYWATKRVDKPDGKQVDVKLYVYRKRASAPDKAAPALPVLFLVHGSSASGRSSFDLTVPGRQYSLMSHFAALGYDVWTVDHEGYGRSDKTSGNSDISSGAD